VTAVAIPNVIRELPLGQRIKWARKRAGLSHDSLVDRVGSTRSHLIKIEKGKVNRPRQELRDRIADATGVPRELFTDEDDEEGDQVKNLDDFLRVRVRQIMREEMRKLHEGDA
jgi:transcriptional regulator with XRE-family HTH domain